MSEIEEVLRNQTDYVADKMDEIQIDGNVFTGYGAYSFLWEKSYVKSPVRSGDGSIGNLNSYSTFLTPHLTIDFSLMSIDTYRRLMKLLYSKNEFTVTCYDIVNDTTTTQSMYFTTEEMPKLYTISRAIEGQNKVVLAGVQDYTVEMVGTNNSVDTVSVVYNLNAPSGTSTTTNIGALETVMGNEFIVGNGVEYDYKNETFNGAYKFVGWNTKADGSGMQYIDGSVYTITTNSDIVLYAMWESSNIYTLTYSYGLGAPRKDSNNEEIVSKQIRYGDTYGELPNSLLAPTVEYDGQVYSPYHNGGWYKTAVKGVYSTALTSYDIYGIKGNSTIYQLYDTHSYRVAFDTQGGTPNFDTITAPYGSIIALPKPIKNGYVFDGWTLNEKAFNGTMPPFNITLVAKWRVE